MTQNDEHRTGCGCAVCGPERRDPLTFDWEETRAPDLSLNAKLSRIEGIISEHLLSLEPSSSETLKRIQETLGVK
jgi:hypothetical protein